jgi:hypothetical protein
MALVPGVSRSGSSGIIHGLERATAARFSLLGKISGGPRFGGFEGGIKKDIFKQRELGDIVSNEIQVFNNRLFH